MLGALHFQTKKNNGSNRAIYIVVPISQICVPAVHPSVQDLSADCTCLPNDYKFNKFLVFLSHSNTTPELFPLIWYGTNVVNKCG